MKNVISENEECMRNVEAILWGLVQGIDLDVFRDRLADLPALSIYSDYHIVDYIYELECQGSIFIDTGENQILISDADLEIQARRYENSGKARLMELGV